ncbi:MULTISPECIES: DUF6018 family natural product bioysynthesis protein [Niallia]|uniref:DUF6018 family natural product bioysynthesis protein n=1 Tax=Niallia TaxID=2837506 RepID=UPI00119D9AB3|nr:DUF6018 family natural product bioysynthesis protein [Niallia circulans]QJX65093.1 hypothetical protein HLK66_25750 [Niallia circulans]
MMKETISKGPVLQGNVFEESKRKAEKIIASKPILHSRHSIEIILPDGERRIFKAKSVSKEHAFNEFLVFIECLEQGINSKVMWRYKGDKVYHFSTTIYEKPSTITRLKKAIMGYFFDIE